MPGRLTSLFLPESAKKNDGLQVFHDDEEGGDIRAEVGAELWQEGAQAGGRQEDHRQHDRRQGQSQG